jgi:hypothetical protein
MSRKTAQAAYTWWRVTLLADGACFDVAAARMQPTSAVLLLEDHAGHAVFAAPMCAVHVRKVTVAEHDAAGDLVSIPVKKEFTPPVRGEGGRFTSGRTGG